MEMTTIVHCGILVAKIAILDNLVGKNTLV